MIKYIPFYPHDFFNDPRILELEPREQQQWLFMLAKMMLTQAAFPENYRAIGRMLDISANSAQKLVARLKVVGLLTASDTGSKLFTLSSRRLTREYEQSKAACMKASAKSKAANDARWHKEQAD